MKKNQLRELKRWAQQATKGQRDSAAFLSLFSPQMVENPSADPVPVIQLGYAMLLDKPIVIVAPLGTPVPANIRRVALAVEFYEPQNFESMKNATVRALAKAEIVPGLTVPE